MLNKFTNIKIRKALFEIFKDIDQSKPETVPIKFTYVPLSHSRALDPEVVLVEGIRGSGKSFWWAALKDDDHRTLVQQTSLWSSSNRELIVSHGFGASGSINEGFPSSKVIVDLVESGISPTIIWRSVIVKKIAKKDLFESWKERSAWVSSHTEDFDRMLYEKNEILAKKNQLQLILFDALDRLAPEWETIRILSKALFQQALELREYSNIRLKLFVRPDMLEDQEILHFPDAAKLLARKASLDWSRADLYGLLFQGLGNSSSAGDEFRRITASLFSKKWKKDIMRWSAPESFISEEIQMKIFHKITGELMAETDPLRKRGIPYSWLVNHLMDGRGQVSPRSFGAALHKASLETQEKYPTSRYPLHFKAIHSGVQDASQIRVNEICTDDYPWITTVMEPLRNNISVPCYSEEITNIWKNENLLEKLKNESGIIEGENSKTGPANLDEKYPGILKELESIGVIQRLRDGRIQMPDIYRIAFGFGRKGGVKSLK